MQKNVDSYCNCIVGVLKSNIKKRKRDEHGQAPALPTTNISLTGWAAIGLNVKGVKKFKQNLLSSAESYIDSQWGKKGKCKEKGIDLRSESGTHTNKQNLSRIF